MSASLTVSELYEALRTKLELVWAAGALGAQRTIDASADEDPTISLVGHLNFIHPHRVQVLGKTELDYLQGLRKNSRKDAVTQLFSGKSDCVVISAGHLVPDDIRQRAEATGIPVFASRLNSSELVNNLQYYLTNRFAETVTLHGVFMEVMGIGVLLTGDASVGKSELALELVSRGHRLIADDAPEFARIAPDILSGTCPEVLRDFLEVRGLGVLNIRAMFGDSAIKHNKYLRLVIRIENMSDEQLNLIDRLRGSARIRTVLGVEIPEVTLPVAPGRNLAVLVEAAARNHILRLKGYDASRVFIERQQRHIEQDTV